MHSHSIQLVRGDLVVAGSPSFPGDVPSWLAKLDGEPFEKGLSGTSSEPERVALRSLCSDEQRRYDRSMTKLGGDDCRIRVTVRES